MVISDPWGLAQQKAMSRQQMYEMKKLAQQAEYIHDTQAWVINSGTSSDTVTIPCSQYTGGFYSNAVLEQPKVERKKSDVDWLRERVNEMRVKLA